VERGITLYPVLLAKWKKDMGKKFIKNIAKLGYEWTGSKLRFEGPLAHLIFSDDTAPDPGYLRAADPRDVRRRLENERQERNRTAHRMNRGTDLVDYTVTGLFKVRMLPIYRAF